MKFKNSLKKITRFLSKLVIASVILSSVNTLTPVTYGDEGTRYLQDGNFDVAVNYPLTSNTTLSNIDFSIAIFYDDLYYENILRIGKEIKLELTAKNTSTKEKMIQFCIAFFDNNNSILDVVVENSSIPVNITKTVTIAKLIEQNNISKSIVYIFDNLINSEPYIALTLTPTAIDYYGNSFTTAATITKIDKLITGSINPVNDNDYIKFTSPSSGSYNFQCFSATGGMNLTGYLYNSSQTLLASNTGNDSYSITANLTAGQIYYLRSIAVKTGDYFVCIQKSSDLQAFNIYNYDVEINGYKNNIKTLCDSAFSNGNKTLSQNIYNEYELLYNNDLLLHEMPDYLKSMSGMADYDAKVKAYFAMKRISFESLKASYLSLLSNYTGKGMTSIENNEFPDSLFYDEVEPQGGGIAPLMFTGKEKSRNEDQNERENNEIVTRATPSLIITSTSASPPSITYTATFPTANLYCNSIYLYDFNQGATIITNPSNSMYEPNGTKTLTGLIAGGIYLVCMQWSTDNGYTYGGKNSIYRRVQLPPATDGSMTSAYSPNKKIKSTIETADMALATSSYFNTWLQNMDTVYSKLVTLTGNKPYNDTTIELKSTRENMNINSPDGLDYWYLQWGYSGNPAMISRPFYRSLMLRLNSSTPDWGDVAIHELSHDFDINDWCFDYEVLADLKLCYVLENTTGSRIYRIDTMKYYTGNDIYSFLKQIK